MAFQRSKNFLFTLHIKFNTGKSIIYDDQEKSFIKFVVLSNGGHLFAVIDANIIQIISPLYLKVIHRLNHGQTVRMNFIV